MRRVRSYVAPVIGIEIGLSLLNSLLLIRPRET